MSFNGLFSQKSITQNFHSRSFSFALGPPLYHIISIYSTGPGNDGQSDSVK